MKRTIIVLVALVVLATAIASCGGGTPAEMTTYEASAFTVEYPEAWQEESMDFPGMTMIVIAEEELSLEDIGNLDQPPDLGFVMLTYTPSADSDISLEALEEITEDEDVRILSRGDMTVGGRKGKYVKASGAVEEGGDEFGILMVVAEVGDNTLAFIGMSPERTWGNNEEIFDYMVRTIKFL